MLDYNFMNLCDQVEIFFTDLYKEYTRFYYECSQFLSSPCAYMCGKNQILRDQTENMPVHSIKKRTNKIKTHHKQISSQMWQKNERIKTKPYQTPVVGNDS